MVWRPVAGERWVPVRGGAGPLEGRGLAWEKRGRGERRGSKEHMAQQGEKEAGGEAGPGAGRGQAKVRGSR